MSLINEINGINYTLNSSRKEKEERERLKRLKAQYNNTIKTELQAEFYAILSKYGVKDGYNAIIKNKDDIIETITNRIEGIKYYNTEIYKYRDFDIFQDLYDNYYKVLNKTQKDFVLLDKIKKEELTNKLYNYLDERFKNAESKKVAYKILSQKKYIDIVISNITENEHEKNILYSEYIRTLNKIKAMYNGYIMEETENEKNIKQLKKQKERNRNIKHFDYLYTLHLINKALDCIK